MKALHTPDTTTLLMNTVLLISSGKYHSYFTLSPLSRGSNSETPPPPPPAVGMDGEYIPTKHWKSCSESGVPEIPRGISLGGRWKPDLAVHPPAANVGIWP